MTSAPINDIAVMPAYRGGKKADNAALNQAEEVFGSFQNAMTQARTGQDNVTADDSVNVSSVGSTRTLDVFSSKPEVKTVDQTDAVKETETVAEENGAEEVQVDETAKEKIEEVAEETTKDVVEEIAEELDVPEDEVVKAMEELGLTVMDLMDPAKMAALVTQLQSGESDPMALLTDEGLYATIQQLTEAVGNIVSDNAEMLSEELGVDVEQIMQLLQDSMESGEADALLEQPVLVEVDGEPVVTETDEQTQPVTNQEGDAETEEVVLNKELDAAETDTTGGQNQSMMDSSDRPATPLINQMYQAQNTTNVEAPVGEMNFASYVDANEIINQIGEYVKVHNAEGISEMEILLNPENLGNIHLQVASKEGVITATITTQNEAVQEALMVQALVLKEELSAQGMKVEAVEVTVASHEFERDMHEGGEEAKEMFEQQVQKQSRRRLVVDGMMHAEELLADEDLTDADKLQIDMMARSGNSVDFMA